MSRQKDRQMMDNFYNVHKVLLQSGTKGIRPDEIGQKLGIDRTTVYSHLATLKRMKKAESEQGVWYAKTEKQADNQLEKEIIIELPIPKDQWQRLVILEGLAKDWEQSFGEKDNVYRISLEKLKETRTIRIRGKNVDDLDLQKMGELVTQASRTSSFNLKGLFKNLKKAMQQSSKSSET
jgi:hypothetical protein